MVWRCPFGPSRPCARSHPVLVVGIKVARRWPYPLVLWSVGQSFTLAYLYTINTSGQAMDEYTKWVYQNVIGGPVWPGLGWPTPWDQGSTHVHTRRSWRPALEGVSFAPPLINEMLKVTNNVTNLPWIPGLRGICLSGGGQGHCGPMLGIEHIPVGPCISYTLLVDPSLQRYEWKTSLGSCPNDLSTWTMSKHQISGYYTLLIDLFWRKI